MLSVSLYGLIRFNLISLSFQRTSCERPCPKSRRKVNDPSSRIPRKSSWIVEISNDLCIRIHISVRVRVRVRVRVCGYRDDRKGMIFRCFRKN